MKIKALSLWQPWASLIAVGAKKYETRSWATNYRGPLLICAAKTSLVHINIMVLIEALYLLGCEGSDLPYGQAIAIVDLTNIWRICEEFCKARIWQEKMFGDYTLGRYAWKLENVRAIEPFPVKGRQGLFEVEIPEGII